MLRWSGQEEGSEVDLAAVTRGDGDGGLAHGAALVAFTEAAAGWDPGALAAARDALEAEAGEAFMIDAAAVVANFEMMTRVADGTGARFTAESDRQRARLDSALGIGGFTSARHQHP